MKVKRELLDWQKLGLQQTATGYGKKLTTPYKVSIGSRWYRVYCCIYSNSGLLYVDSKRHNVSSATLENAISAMEG